MTGVKRMNKDEIILQLSEALLSARGVLVQCYLRMAMNDCWGPEIEYAQQMVEKIDEDLRRLLNELKKLDVEGFGNDFVIVSNVNIK